MKILLLDGNKINKLILPNNIIGNFTVFDSNNESIINIEGMDNKWILRSNDDIKIYNPLSNLPEEQHTLNENEYCILKNKIDTKRFYLFSLPIYDASFKQFIIKSDKQLYIGNNDRVESFGNQNDISIEANEFAGNQISFIKSNGKYVISNMNISNYDLYINNEKKTQAVLEQSDSIFYMGTRIFFVNNMILINDYTKTLKYNKNSFEEKVFVQYDNIIDDDQNSQIINEEYFQRPPVILPEIDIKEITIDSPPQPQVEQSMPFLYTFAPMAVMGLVSLVSAASAIVNMANGTATLLSTLPTILMAVSMLTGSLIFPSLRNKYMKNHRKKVENKRQQKYKLYLENKEALLKKEINSQEMILNEKFQPISECVNIILEKKPLLFSRNSANPDFLTLRVGTGIRPTKINLTYEAEKFSIEDDPLKIEMLRIVAQSKYLKNIPITINFSKKNISALIGKPEETKNFFEGLIIQAMTYFGYDNLKFVILTSESNKEYWRKIANTPFCWNDDYNFRFFATSLEEANQVSNFLDEVLTERIDQSNEKKENDNKNEIYNVHYLIITDCMKNVRHIGLIEKVLNNKINIGFNIVTLDEKLNNVPNECSTIIDITNNKIIGDNEEIGAVALEDGQSYNLDRINFSIEEAIEAVSNINLELEKTYNLPASVSFLEMYNVGNVVQLNSVNRWKVNDPSKSLQAPVGLDENGGLFKLDLHEKMHGPHGLIAGMTGSGKSEFIITFILSMAVNYSPLEVNFVIIDYKGGGLAGAFENKKTGKRLPHIVGTITNLDENNMNRSLASIKSELKRRQDVFNKVRTELSENTMDIYKYQRLYREDKIKEPMAHLFIISDEFAELKKQQPDFMDELMSIARIGRSLGVHLILATQKPSGVVNDQIWSNAKFKVCLKVQEKSDSNDMISRPDAAALRQTGRFYLLVGYNDYFAMGQSAWCGAQYYETDKREDKVDTSISLVDDLGVPIKTLQTEENNTKGIHKGEELSNILDYLIEIADFEKEESKKLWLDPIPNVIYTNDVAAKYNYHEEKFQLAPIIGEYDNPYSQLQNVAIMPITKEGNAIIYGSAGSGKELILSTIIHSLITNHNAEEVNIYVIDFGSGSLSCFKKAPQVGDIVNSSDREKITNLFKLLFEEIEKRKQEFYEYNGDYETYCKKSGKTLPMIIVIINNFEAFSESISADEELATISRDGTKYGIRIIITVSSSSGVRYRLSQYYKILISLQLNDASDYRTIYGNINKLKPAKSVGRGLLRLDNVYEFQTSYPCEKNNFSDLMKQLCIKLQTEATNFAKRIPILPDVVTFDEVKDDFDGLEMVPIGISKNDLKVIGYNFIKGNSLLVLAQDKTSYINFMNSLSFELSKLTNVDLFIFDTNIPGNTDYNYIATDHNDGIQKLQFLIDEIKSERLDKEVFIIINGIFEISNLIGPEKFALFTKSLEKLDAKVILFETVFNIKKYELDSWYRKTFNSNNGLWIGQGMSEQFSIKTTTSSRNLINAISSDFGYAVNNGNSELIKIIDFTSREEENEE